MKDNFDHYAWNHKRRLFEEKEYEVEYWKYTEDGYDNEYITVKAKSEEEALSKAKDQTRLGKKYKIYKG
jgi:hypothetical protein